MLICYISFYISHKLSETTCVSCSETIVRSELTFVCHLAVSRCGCSSWKQRVYVQGVCLGETELRRCTAKYKRLTPAFNRRTHRKQLFAFPARTTHSALVTWARWRPLLRTVLVGSIFTLHSHSGSKPQHLADHIRA